MASAAHSSAWPAARPCSRPSSPPLPEAPGARGLPDGALPPAGPARPGAPGPRRRRPLTAHGLRLGLPSRALDGGWRPGSEVSWGRPGAAAPAGRRRAASGGPRASRPVCARPPCPLRPLRRLRRGRASRVLASADAAACCAVSPPTSPGRLRGGSTLLQVAALVGAGPGLTPSGDDALCGVLLALRAVGGGAAHAATAGRRRPRSGTCHDEPVGLLPRRCRAGVCRARGRAPRPRHRGRRRARPASARSAVLAIGHTLAPTSSPACRHHDALGHGSGAPVPVHPHLHTEGASRA